MARLTLGAIVAVFGMFIFISNLMRLGDSDPETINAPYTTGDLVAMVLGWLLFGVGLYLLIKGPKRSDDS